MTKNNFIKKLVGGQLLLIMLAGFLIAPAAAIEPLAIANINITYTDKTATITWTTNRPAFGKIRYGLYPNDYSFTIQTNQKITGQAITLSGLFPETNYFFRIIANDDISEVTSFAQNFKTKKLSDNKAPEIADVQTAYTTGTTATIQWLTDEPATSEIEYGLGTNYGSTKVAGQLVRVHDLTLTGLIDGTTYHFRVKSKDADNNVSLWYDLTFRTQLTDKSDRDELIIYNIKPASENDPTITVNSAVISWRTNKLAEGWVLYGTTTGYNKTVATNPPKNFSQSVALAGLNPGTTYYFQVEVRDILGKVVKSNGLSFTTKIPPPSSGQNPPPQILGTATCDINLKTNLGYFGLYYNLPEGHPDMQLSPRGWTKVGRQNDWYNPEYFSLSRTDSRLDFGEKFFPLNEDKAGDPFHFAVNWRAIISVPSNDFYSYTITSDDDSWVFIDDRLTSDLNGIHAAKTETKEIQLAAGYHKLEIYYAERSRSNATLSFQPDLRLKFHPLPEGCEIPDVLSYNQTLTASPLPLPSRNGQVLGVSNIIPAASPVSLYPCNPNLGYTKIKALYKTADSPDVWAILETKQKHYITSPAAFQRYQCNWGAIKTVSKKILASYSNATLVRTPDNPTIYHLFQRPEHQWLKINIPSPTVFVSYPKNYWGNVARVDILDILAYPEAKLIKVGGKPEVYLIEGTNKRPIKSEEVFERRLFDWAEVVELSQIHLDSYENGPVVD